MSLAKYFWAKPYIPVVEFVGATTSGDGSPITPPAGTTAGDLIVVAIAEDGDPAIPSGWTEAMTHATSTSIQYGIYDDEVSFDFTAGTSSVSMAVFRNADWGGISANGSDSGDIFPSLSGFNAGDICLAVFAAYFQSGYTGGATQPSGFETAAALKVDVGSYLDFTTGIFYKPSESATETPEDTYTGYSLRESIATIRLSAI